MKYKEFVKTCIVFLSYFFVPKYRIWKPVFYSWIIVTPLLVMFFFSYNLRNNTLEKKIGVIDEFYYKYYNHRNEQEVFFNFKIQGDTLRYGQFWNLPLIKTFDLFFFGTRYVPAKIGRISKGDTIVFYTDKKPVPFKTLVWFDEDLKTGKETLHITDKSEKFIITTYGMILNNKVYMSYKKRAFVSKEINLFYIVEGIYFLILFPMFSIKFSSALLTWKYWRL